jgi:NAD+ kinase
MKRIAAIANCDKPEVARVLREITEWGKRNGIEVVANAGHAPDEAAAVEVQFDSARMAELRRKFAGCDIAVTLGGDGTLLFGAHVVAPLGIPILSVNLGSLGFHAQVEPDNLFASLATVRAGGHRIERRLLLEARIVGQRKGADCGATSAIALNDIVVSKSAWGRMVHLRLHINGMPASDLYADGLLIATPTGSSAYNYAARGPVLTPSMEAIVINAICPHRMRFSPVVIGADSLIEVEFHPRKPLEEAQLFVDGQAWCAVAHGQTLNISRASVYLPLIVFDQDYFSKLRTKLAWGGLT